MKDLDDIRKDIRAQMEDLVPDVLIHNVQFDHAEGMLEISFAEVRDQAEGMGMLKTIALERELFLSEVTELESDLRDLVDEVQIAIRNKDARQARIDKAIARNRSPEPEEDDDE